MSTSVLRVSLRRCEGRAAEQAEADFALHGAFDHQGNRLKDFARVRNRINGFWGRWRRAGSRSIKRRSCGAV